VCKCVFTRCATDNFEGVLMAAWEDSLMISCRKLVNVWTTHFVHLRLGIQINARLILLCNFYSKHISLRRWAQRSTAAFMQSIHANYYYFDSTHKWKRPTVFHKNPPIWNFIEVPSVILKSVHAETGREEWWENSTIVSGANRLLLVTW
jgi:hypothetical protein